MPDRSRYTPARISAGIKRRALAAAGKAPAPDSGSAEAELGRQKLYVSYLEQRLHIAEYKLAQLEPFGLVDALSDDPAAFARWLTWRPPGHFYSTVPNLHEIEAQSERLWRPGRGREVPGIRIDSQDHLDLFARISEYASQIELHPHAVPEWRYYTDNPAYGPSDALVLHGMLRIIEPKRMIEIGSGHSSAMTLDTVERFLGNKTDVTFIEPYPELLESLLTPEDLERVTIVPTGLQSVPLERFSELTDGDLLFIDSTHVLKTGSDVVYLYNELLPRLNPGVYIHIHDIFHAFEYPNAWVMEGRAWGECYILQSFLAFNSEFEVLFFSDWFANFHEDEFRRGLPGIGEHTPGSIWLRRRPGQ